MLEAEPNLWHTLAHLVTDLGQLVVLLLSFLATWILFIAWITWWLLAVNWKRCWEALASGAWAPVVLLMLVTALVWSRLEPTACTCLSFVTIPNFWWQLGYVSMLVTIAFFCGWLQGVFHWAPAELDLEPPVHGFEHVHDHSLHTPPDKVTLEPHH